MIFTTNFNISPPAVSIGQSNITLSFDGQAANNRNLTPVQITYHLPNSADVRWLSSHEGIVAQNGKELIVTKNFLNIQQTFFTSAVTDTGGGLIPGDVLIIGMVTVDLTDKTQETEFANLAIQ